MKYMSKAEEILDKHIGIRTAMDLKKKLVLEAMKEIASISFQAGGKNEEQFIEELFKSE